ncbi:hypothetical protein ANO14919_050890 [Xylariales sp. No.14919]|nr:hypothetical protein ANO14919_050890 [Xylariales sp. No.14919]
MSNNANFNPKLAPLHGVAPEGYFKDMAGFAICSMMLVSIKSDLRYLRSTAEVILDDPGRFNAEDRQAIESIYPKMEAFSERIKILYRDIMELPDPYNLDSEKAVKEGFQAACREFEAQSAIACCRLFPPQTLIKASDKPFTS